MQASCQIVGIEVYNLPCVPIPDDCVQHEEQNQAGRKPTEMKAGKGKQKDLAPRGHMTCTLSLCLMQKLLNILTWSEGWQDNFRQSKVVSKVLAGVGHILQVIYMLCTMCMWYLRSMCVCYIILCNNSFYKWHLYWKQCHMKSKCVGDVWASVCMIAVPYRNTKLRPEQYIIV
jgi:hypothetical protein